MGNDTNRLYYDALSGLYERVYGDSDHERVVRDCVALLESCHFIPLARDRGIKRLKLLELGCGAGVALPLWRVKGFEVTGVDASKSMLDLAHARNASLPSASRLICADILSSAFVADIGSRYDVVVAHFNFPNLFAPTELERVFQHVHTLLSDGGVWLVDFYRPTTPLEPFDEVRDMGGVEIRVRGGRTEQGTWQETWTPVVDAFEPLVQEGWFHSLEDYGRIAQMTGFRYSTYVAWPLPEGDPRPWAEAEASTTHFIGIFRR